jgi:2-oxoglutarate/2-oxoacid ferredoxin oxidoreductase subunit alpha
MSAWTASIGPSPRSALPGKAPGVNDFSCTIATANGTGSASANALLVRAVLRMGVPVSGKNLLPSNIQGMPTWYEIRVNGAGHTARTGLCHLMVAMNAQTLAQDVAAVAPGGYVLYDSTGVPSCQWEWDDVGFLGIPLSLLVRGVSDDPRQRVVLRNVAYVGALAALLAVDPTVVAAALSERFEERPDLDRANQRAFELGFDYAESRLDCPLPFHVSRMRATTGAVLIDGNTSTAIGCLFAGATVAAWYPITPSTSVMDRFAELCARYRRVPDSSQEPGTAAGTASAGGGSLDTPSGQRDNYLILQAEDELAAIGMVVGASWNGARAFTATSGPGLSLMGELLGLAYYAEIPAVVFDVQRSGPSTGMPTRTQQADLLEAAYASHGDTKHLLLFPADPKECFDFAVAAFDVAERFQTPVLVLSDFDIGMNDWVVPSLSWDDGFQPDRGRLLSREDLAARERYFRYDDWDDMFVAARTLPGVAPNGAYFTRGSGHDSLGEYTEAPQRYREVVDRLAAKHAAAAGYLPVPLVEHHAGARVGVITLGSADAAVRESLEELAERGVLLDYLRVRSFPFHPAVGEFIGAHDRCIVVEQNRDGQLRSLLVAEAGAAPERLGSVRCYDGLPVSVPDVMDRILLEFGR